MKRLLTICLTLFVLISLHAEEPIAAHEECQNAAASLTYYLEQLCLSLSNEQDNPAESIPFSDEEVLQLWMTLESYCCRESSQAHAQSFSDAFHTFRNLDFSKPKENIFTLIFPCFLEVQSLWLSSIQEDPLQTCLEDFENLSEQSDAFLSYKKDLLTMHVCNQIQNRLSSTLQEEEKCKLQNLYQWINRSGPLASKAKWRKWKNYYSSSIKDPIKASFKFSSSYNDFHKNPQLSPWARKKLTPHLLPKNHPVKPSLDKIFLQTRATQTPKALRDAGFQILSVQGRSFIHVLAHPTFPNYLLKAVVDSELRKKRKKAEWEWFMRRCECAKKIANLINKYHIQSFTVPKKWIYPLPLKPSPPSSSAYKQKSVVLVVQKMDLIPYQETLNKWKHHVTKEQLKELYTVASRLARVSIRPDNIPFTASGKIAFVDTEYKGSTPSYGFIRPYLSPEMRAYWDHLVSKGGKK